MKAWGLPSPGDPDGEAVQSFGARECLLDSVA